MKVKLYLTILLSVFALSCAAQTPRFNAYERVTRDKEREKSMSEFLKLHKKKYGYSSAKIENWIDGKTYIVASKNKEYSIFNLEGEPILTNNGNLEWFTLIFPDKKEGYTLFVIRDNNTGSHLGFATERSKIIAMPQRFLNEYEFTEYGGKTYIKGYEKNTNHKWPKTGALVALDGGVIFNYGDNVDKVDYNECSNIFYITKFKKKIQNVKSYHTTILADKNGQRLDSMDGVYLAAADCYGIVNLSHSMQPYNIVYPNFEAVNYSIGYNRNSAKLLDANGVELIDSVSELTYLQEPRLFTYTKIVDDELRMGLINPSDRTKDIPPLYSELIVEPSDDGSWQVKVRPTLLAEELPYEKGVIYPRNYANEAERLLEMASIDSLFKAYYGRRIDELERSELICLARGALRKYKVIEFYQNGLLEHYSTIRPIFTGNYKKVEDFYESFNYQKIEPIDMTMRACLEQLAINGDERTIEIVQSLSEQNEKIFKQLIANRDSIIPEAKEQYFARGNMATAEYEAVKQKLIEQKEEAERQKKARQLAMLQSWAESARQASEAFRARQEAKAAAAKASKGGKNSGKSYASGGSSSSGSGDKSGRIAFLKGQIADWENKLRKAEASYQEAKEIASRQGSWESNNVVKSKENTVREYAEELAKYKAELQSLQ